MSMRRHQRRRWSGHSPPALKLEVEPNNERDPGGAHGDDDVQSLPPQRTESDSKMLGALSCTADNATCDVGAMADGAAEDLARAREEADDYAYNNGIINKTSELIRPSSASLLEELKRSAPSRILRLDALLITTAQPTHERFTPSIPSSPTAPISQEMIISPSQQTTFLSLPPEIRHHIYRLLPSTVVTTRPLIYCLSTSHKQHPLYNINRLIRREVLAIFYSSNTWLIKLDHRIMYDAFKSWISGIGDTNAGNLRVVEISVRGKMFTPCRPPRELFIGQDGRTVCVASDDVVFRVDLSERVQGGVVEIKGNKGPREEEEMALAVVKSLVEVMWRKRLIGGLRVRDWVWAVEGILNYTGWLM